MTNPSGQCWYDTNVYIETTKKLFLHTLTELEVDRISEVYELLYKGTDLLRPDIIIPPSSHKTSELLVSGEIFGSKSSKNSRSSFVRAFWSDKDGKILQFKDYDEDSKPRLGIITEFVKHTFMVDGKGFTHWFACVEWCLSFVSQSITNYFGEPVECWKAHGRVNKGPASFIPVFRILDKCVHSIQKVQGNDALVTIPRIRNSSF